MTTDTTTRIGDPAELTVVKMLITGHDEQFVAQACGITRAAVHDIGRAHGAPDVAKLRAAVADYDRRPIDLPTRALGHVPRVAPRPTAPAPRPLDPAPLDPPPAAAAPTDGRFARFTDLLARAATAGDKQTAQLLDRLHTAADRLAAHLDDLDADQDRRRQAEQARAEVARLTAELAAARAAAKAAAKPAVSRDQLADRGVVSSKTIRDWAITAGFQMGGKGRLPRRVLDAYNAAHPGRQS